MVVDRVLVVYSVDDCRNKGKLSAVAAGTSLERLILSNDVSV
jgi:hypothetical protein